MALDHNGDVYSCDHYVYPQYKLGNILDSDFGKFAEDPDQIDFGRYKSNGLSAECRECDYRFACHGGCPKHRLVVNSDDDPPANYLCPAYKIFFRHADAVLQLLRQAMHLRRPVDEIMTQLRRRAVENAKRKGKMG
ncbi:MAG: SPASM domain-containing protein, partial [Arenicellales bacterium]|nr:SPASM domain-containing protein [Arenicellales bacterium]